MARIRRGVSLLAMGTIVLGALLIVPAIPGKAMGTPLVFPSTPHLSGTVLAQNSSQSGGSMDTLQIQPSFSLSSHRKQAPSASEPRNVAGSKRIQAAEQDGGATETQTQPSASGGGAPIQSITSTDESQGSEQEITQTSDGENTFVGLSGPFSVNISWGEEADTNGVPTTSGRVRAVSATLMVGGITSNYQVSIDWGDGTIAHNLIGKDFSNKSFHLSGMHQYTNAGSYQVSFAIIASDGSQVMASRVISVS